MLSFTARTQPRPLRTQLAGVCRRLCAACTSSSRGAEESLPSIPWVTLMLLRAGVVWQALAGPGLCGDRSHQSSTGLGQMWPQPGAPCLPDTGFCFTTHGIQNVQILLSSMAVMWSWQPACRVNPWGPYLSCLPLVPTSLWAVSRP